MRGPGARVRTRTAAPTGGATCAGVSWAAASVGVVMVPTANLRAYVPLEAFPPEERERWRAYVSAGEGVSLSEARATEERVAAARLLSGRGPLHEDAALVRRVGNRLHLCPLQLELRAATALRELRYEVPDEVVEEFVPDRAARDTLDLLGASGRAPHILDTSWVIPLTWFTLFGPDERHLVDPPEGRGPRLTYLTVGSRATERVERAIEIVESTLEDGDDVLVELADVGAWVDSFDPDSIIELDYGSIAALFGPGELEQDRTCHEVWSALEGLVEGDVMAAAAYYGVARSRWRELRAKQYAS